MDRMSLRCFLLRTIQFYAQWKPWEWPSRRLVNEQTPCMRYAMWDRNGLAKPARLGCGTRTAFHLTARSGNSALTSYNRRRSWRKGRVGPGQNAGDLDTPTQARCFTLKTSDNRLYPVFQSGNKQWVEARKRFANRIICLEESDPQEFVRVY